MNPRPSLYWSFVYIHIYINISNICRYVLYQSQNFDFFFRTYRFWENKKETLRREIYIYIYIYTLQIKEVKIKKKERQ